MARIGLTPRPPVPALVRVATLGALLAAPAGCGDDQEGDSGSDSNTTDQHPTAGPCAHLPDSPECATSTGEPTTGDSASATGTGGTESTATTSVDTHPTIPCAHDPMAPGCEMSTATSGTGGDTDTDTDGTGSTGSATGSTTATSG